MSASGQPSDRRGDRAKPMGQPAQSRKELLCALETAADRLVMELSALTFRAPVAYVYNPLEYARAAHDAYVSRYAQPGCRALLLGMNPGPFGMAQTGVPFGDVAMVRDWLGIFAPVGKPPREHPRRPVLGFATQRCEVSGARLWGWARQRWQAPDAFFREFFVANYCPLAFLEESGRNRTPDKLPGQERAALFASCDRALQTLVAALAPRVVIGVGAFAETRARAALAGQAPTGRIPHPSPASPQANRGWAAQVEAALRPILDLPPRRS